MLRVAVLHSGGTYPGRIVEYLASFPGAQVAAYELPSNLPAFLDEEDAAGYLPAEAGEADVVIAVHLHSALLSELPFMMGKATARALLVPREDPSWVRPGLMNQVTRSCARFGIETAFPKPFCALEPMSPLLIEFCEQYKVGRHKFRVNCSEGVITGADYLSGSACGLTEWVVEQLIGLPCDESLEHQVAELLHLRPCLASMAHDPDGDDTIMHHSIAIMEQAGRDAVAEAEVKQP